MSGRTAWWRGALACLALLAFATAWLFPSPRVAAQVVAPPRGIVVTAESHIPDFPKALVFNLEARSEAALTRATLRFKQVGQPTVTTTEVKFEPAKEAALTYTWDLQRYYVPPGVGIEYYWLLEDAAGNRLRTPSRVVALEDTRFAWRALAEGQVALRWYEGDEQFAGQLLQATVKALSQLSADAGVVVDRPVVVHVYANQRDLLSALRPSAQEWTGGQAFPEQGIVVAAVEPNEKGLEFGRRVLPHEVSHVVVHRLTDNPYGDLPRWLDEGIAMYAEGGLEPAYQRALERAIRENRLFSVQSLSANFPADSQAALQSYAQSYSLVKFIVERYGRERLAALLAVFKEGSAFDPALKRALGVDGGALEAEWRAWLGAPPVQPAAPLDSPSRPRVSTVETAVVLLVVGVLLSAVLLASVAVGARVVTQRRR